MRKEPASNPGADSSPEDDGDALYQAPHSTSGPWQHLCQTSVPFLAWWRRTWGPKLGTVQGHAQKGLRPSPLRWQSARTLRHTLELRCAPQAPGCLVPTSPSSQLCPVSPSESPAREALCCTCSFYRWGN